MKFSESWLREWVNPAVSTDELTHQITMAGLEVDDVLPVAGSFTGVKVGHVVECGQHPDGHLSADGSRSYGDLAHAD